MGHLRKEIDKTSTNTNIKYISGKNTKTAECCATEYGMLKNSIFSSISKCLFFKFQQNFLIFFQQF